MCRLPPRCLLPLRLPPYSPTWGVTHGDRGAGSALKAQQGLPVIPGLKEAFLIWQVWVFAGGGLQGAWGLPSPLRLGLFQKPPSASDSDSKPESEGAKGELAAVARSASCSSSASSSSSSDSDVSVKKPPRGRKPGRIAVVALSWNPGSLVCLQDGAEKAIPFSPFVAEKPPPKPRGRKPKLERPPSTSSSDR